MDDSVTEVSIIKGQVEAVPHIGVFNVWQGGRCVEQRSLACAQPESTLQ